MRLKSFFLALILLATTTTSVAEITLMTDSFNISMDEKGSLTGLLDTNKNADYSAVGQGSVLMALKVGDEVASPSGVEWRKDEGIMVLGFDGVGVEAKVKIVEKPSYISFELVALTPLEKANAVFWGPIATSINETVGGVVGVVRNSDFAIGIQALNIKTTGGLLLSDEGYDPGRGAAAVATDWGSTLQAFSLDRSRPRNVDAGSGEFPNMPVPPIEGETVIGSKIALFGCAPGNVLDVIEEIEIAEGLPHPELDGEWAKRAWVSGSSYMISSFSEFDIDTFLKYAEMGGFTSLYHSGPFIGWGQYELSRIFFPTGEKGFRKCAKKAYDKKIRLGVHTLTNFINTNDSYVTPVPDPRLAKTGTALLSAGIDETADEIPVSSPEYFTNSRTNHLRAVQIGEEIIRYGAVSQGEPWKLLRVQRGQLGTIAALHEKGAVAQKLMDHGYKVFLADHDMQGEISENLAALFNRARIGHMDFDGHEGAVSSGQGTYAMDRMAQILYDNLDRNIRIGSSRTTHYLWHILTTINWGEPWYGGFRESMSEYRFNNQPFLRDNYLPGMLGWFRMTENTPIADIEWLMARGAGYDAGFAFVAEMRALTGNPHSEHIMETIRTWEEARRAGAFTKEQQARLRDLSNEFSLEKTGEGEWVLTPYHILGHFTYEKQELQPGQPTFVQWEINNPHEARPLQFEITADGITGGAINLSLEFDNYLQADFPVEIKAGQTLICDGTKTLRLYDSKGILVEEIESAAEIPEILAGPHQVLFDSGFSGYPEPKIKVLLKTQGEPETAGK